MAKLKAARCPTCGATLTIPEGAHHVQCRYCANTIAIEHRKPPAQARTGAPSTTLYIDPNAALGKWIAGVITASVALPFVLALVAGAGPWLARKAKSSVLPYPATCGLNETIEMTGDWQGAGPVVTSAGHNCKIKISKGKIKASTLLKTDASNVEITLEDVTLETTEPLVEGGSNIKLRVKGGSLTSAANVLEAESNLDVTLENTTVVSSGATAVKAGHNLKLAATSSRIVGKKAAVEADANASLTLKKACEVTSEGVAIKTKSGLKLDADGGKLEGAEAAIEATSGAKIVARATTFTSNDKTLVFSSGATIEATEGAIVSQTAAAIESDGGDFELAGTKVQGGTSGIVGRNNLRLDASKKATITGTSGNGIDVSSNPALTIADATVQGGRAAIKASSNARLKLTAGARLVGKRGGIVAEGNLELESTAATIEGGSGPAIEGGYNARITLRQGAVKGAPALALARKPASFENEGARIEGEQKISAR